LAHTLQEGIPQPGNPIDNHSRGTFAMRTAIRELTTLVLLPLALSSCGKKSSALSSAIPEPAHLIEIYEEAEALPLNTLIASLREKARAKMPPRGLAASIQDTYAACGATLSIPGTQLCIFTAAKGMNYALNRASHWIEAQELVDHEGLRLINERLNVQGHNLAGQDLKEFGKVYAQAKGSFDQTVPPIAEPGRSNELGIGLGLEREFWSTYLQKKIDTVPKLYLLAVTTYDTEALNHEVLHALHYSNAEMQKLVREFWLEELSLSERWDIIAELASTGGYAVENDDPAAPSFLLLNEFQAYVLMERSAGDVDKFEGMSKLYKARLSKKLLDKDIQLPDTKAAPSP
jgi:hypothetical protein